MRLFISTIKYFKGFKQKNQTDSSSNLSDFFSWTFYFFISRVSDSLFHFFKQITCSLFYILYLTFSKSNILRGRILHFVFLLTFPFGGLFPCGFKFWVVS